MAFDATDRRFMALALSLGRRGLGQTWPNPSVGAVIVNQGRIVGRGWTRPGGRPHAETLALAEAGAAAKGACVYVTLEPCAHHGQTPPCADQLIAAGVSRVVSTIDDPDPRVAGQGHARLKAAGIRVETGCLDDQAKRDHAGFLLRILSARPLVSLKLATSFDGRIATHSGESQWITGPEARRVGHLMRARHDAVMIGCGTARADDPMLTVRGLGIERQPVRLVLDSKLGLSPESRLAETAGEIPLWICHGETAAANRRDRLSASGARLIECATSQSGRIELTDLFSKLAAIGLNRVYCEGGGQIAASLLAAGLVDQLIGFTAGLALGADGISAIGKMPESPLADKQRFILRECQTVGADILHVWSRQPAFHCS